MVGLKGGPGGLEVAGEFSKIWKKPLSVIEEIALFVRMAYAGVRVVKRPTSRQMGKIGIDFLLFPMNSPI